MMNEARVQKILKSWFEKKGFKTQENVRINGNKVDLKTKNGDEEWIIEIKGDYDSYTSQYFVNFESVMGQILKSITAINDKKYAICIPFSRTERGEKLSYRLILTKYLKSILFEVLNVHIILVRDDESVEVILPKDVRKFLSTINPKIRARHNYKGKISKK